MKSLTTKKQKPLLLLDVDGVLAITSPFGRPKGSGAGGRLGFLLVFGYQAVYVDRRALGWMRKLAERFEIVWATTWMEQANDELGPHLGLPKLAAVPFTGAEQALDTPEFSWKLPAVERYAAGRPFAWVDDSLREDAIAWAAERAEPVLVLRPEWLHGLDEEHLEALLAFADSL